MRGSMAPERIILSAADLLAPRRAREGRVTRQPGSDRTPGPDATDGSGPDAAPDAVGGALDVIDRSIGMYVMRRLTGRGRRASPRSRLRRSS